MTDKVLLGCVVFASFCACGATQRYVSKDKSYGADVEGAVLYDKLQEAVAACENGDTVWVKDGFVCTPEDGYDIDASTGNSTIRAKVNITLRGESGSWQTGPTIKGDKENTIRCVSAPFSNKADTSFKIIGFRLEDGKGLSQGGGLYMAPRTGVVSNCFVANCSATYGGGVYASGNSETMYDSVVSNCTCGTYGGGGVNILRVYDSIFVDNKGAGLTLINNIDPILYRCHFIRNSSSGLATGLNKGHKSTVYDCEFIDNDGSSGGGLEGRALVYDGLFVGNSAANGGAVACYLKTKKGSEECAPDSVVCTRCTFSNNTSTCNGSVGWYGKFVNCRMECNNAKGDGTQSRQGAGVLYGSQAYNCLIANNTAARKGAAIYAVKGYYGEECGCELVNCTVVSNTVTSGGAIVQTDDGVTLSCVNTIVKGNAAPAADTITFATNCCLEATAQVGSGEGNVTCDPKLVKAGKPAEYHLKQASTLIGAGTVLDWMSDETDARSTDLDGLPRLTDGKVNIGCYEKLHFSGMMMLLR